MKITSTHQLINQLISQCDLQLDILSMLLVVQESDTMGILEIH